MACEALRFGKHAASVVEVASFEFVLNKGDQFVHGPLLDKRSRLGRERDFCRWFRIQDVLEFFLLFRGQRCDGFFANPRHKQVEAGSAAVTERSSKPAEVFLPKLWSPAGFHVPQ